MPVKDVFPSANILSKCRTIILSKCRTTLINQTVNLMTSFVERVILHTKSHGVKNACIHPVDEGAASDTRTDPTIPPVEGIGLDTGMASLGLGLFGLFG